MCVCVSVLASLTGSPAAHCCPGPSCPAAGRTRVWWAARREGEGRGFRSAGQSLSCGSAPSPTAYEGEELEASWEEPTGPADADWPLALRRQRRDKKKVFFLEKELKLAVYDSVRRCLMMLANRLHTYTI